MVEKDTELNVKFRCKTPNSFDLLTKAVTLFAWAAAKVEIVYQIDIPTPNHFVVDKSFDDLDMYYVDMYKQHKTYDRKLCTLVLKYHPKENRYHVFGVFPVSQAVDAIIAGMGLPKPTLAQKRIKVTLDLAKPLVYQRLYE